MDYILTAISRKKTISDTSMLTTELHRCLSTLDLTFIGIGGMIGAGIYVLTGEVAKNKAGPAIVFSFLIAALISLLAAFCFSELGARFPKAGSVYLYCYITFGELTAFYIGWNMILYQVMGGAVIVRALSAYIDSLIDGRIKHGTLSMIGTVDVPLLSSYIDIFSFVIVLLFTAIVLLGVKDSARFNTACVLINVITILLVIFVGCGYIEKDNWSNFAPYGASGVFSGSAIAFFSFIGFDCITTMGEEAKNPAWSIPVSLIASIGFCAFAYIGVCAVITLMVPYHALDDTAAVAVAFQQKGLGFMKYIIGIGATLGIAGNTFITCCVVPRQVYAIAQDGMIFKAFSRVNHVTSVPTFAISITCLAMGLFAAILNLDALAETFSGGILLSYTAVSCCVTILRYKTQVITDNTPVNQVEAEDLSLQVNTRLSSKYQNVILHLILITILIFTLIICILVTKYGSNIKHDYFPLVFLCILCLLVFICCLYISCMKQSDDKLAFKVPLVPWLPVISILCNAYLMVNLSGATWIKLLIWFGIGTIVYFTYSIRHSVERDRVYNQLK